MKRQALACGLMVGALLLSGCVVEGNAKYTGGGTFDSAGGTGKAQFTINADTCSGNENARGRVTYSDRTAIDFEGVGGVDVVATVAKAGVCAQGGDSSSLDPDDSECICEGWPAAVGSYVSKNPAAPGEGVFRACFLSTRTYAGDLGGLDPNVILINDVSLVGGPYDGYFNHGTMSGNVQTHACASEG
jgi:hypothetical protein